MVCAMISLIKRITSYSKCCLRCGMLSISVTHCCIGNLATRFGNRDYAVRRGGFEAPGRVACFHAALFGEAQDHAFALLVGHDALEYAVEHEILFHFMHSLVKQEVAFLAVHHREVGFEYRHLGFAQLPKNAVLSKLNADDVFSGCLSTDDMWGLRLCPSLIRLTAYSPVKVDRGQ